MHDTVQLDRQRAYDIRLHVPQGDAPPGGHALVWLLDAPTTWAPMQQALHEAGDPGVVVVGIDWAVEGGVDPSLRRRDFTLPAQGEVPPPRGAEDWTEDGDADAFLGLLTDRLQPRYLDTLPVDPRRQCLVGHSLSGLFVLHALMCRPDRFARYVAASPSIWWDGASMLDDARAANWAAARAARVLLTVGSEEQVTGPEKPPEVAGEDEAALLGEPHMVDNAAAFAELLRDNAVDAHFRLIEGGGHKTVIPAAMAEALAFALGDPDETG